MAEGGYNLAKDLLFKAAKIVTPTAQTNAELAQKKAVGVGCAPWLSFIRLYRTK